MNPNLAIIALFGTAATLSQTASANEDFLPESTPAPAPGAVVIDIGYFDQCESDQDIAIWTDLGGESVRPTHSNFCSREYENGGCLLDSDCIETCFQETYGYSKECSICFGLIPACSMNNDCTTKCMADSLGAECQECNAPCIDELNECTGLPEVDYSVIEASKTVAPTANPAPLLTPKPSFSPTIRSPFPTSMPSISPVVQTDSSTPEPSPQPTQNPVTREPASPQPTQNPVTPEPTTSQPTQNPVTPETITSQPTQNPVTPETATAQPTQNPVKRTRTSRPTRKEPNGGPSSTTPSKPIDPLPSSASPTGSPTAGPVTPPSEPDKNRDGIATENSASVANTMVVFVTMGLLAAVICAVIC